MGWQRQDLRLQGVSLLRPTRRRDQRGHFIETWTRAAFVAIGIDADFVQDNESMSHHAGTVRGLHFQTPPFEQAKLIRVLRGRSFHVAVDLRPQSETYGQWCSTQLSQDSTTQLFIGRGFAHGLMTLAPDTVIAYKADAPYAPAAESGIAWNDPSLRIAWPSVAPVILSERDRRLPFMGAASSQLPQWQTQIDNRAPPMEGAMLPLTAPPRAP